MRIRWTLRAFNDLDQIVDRIRENNPAAAERVARTLCSGIELLETMPNRGRVGRAEKTRELVFPPWPYIVVYEIVEDSVLLIIRIRHASQNWP